MSRISSQGSVIMIDDPDTAPLSATIASATKAAPCAITLVAAQVPPVVGDIVVPRNTTWKSLDDRPFKVITVAGQVVTLEKSDTTREPGAIATSTSTPPAAIETPTWLELCRSTFQLNQPAGATIDVTTLCDDAHRIVPGLPAIGTWTAAGFYDVNDSAMFVAQQAYENGSDVLIDVRFRDGSGVAFAGIVNVFDITLGVNAAVGNTMGGQVDGAVSFYKTPPPGFQPPFVASAKPAPGAPPPARRPAPQPAAA